MDPVIFEDKRSLKRAVAQVTRDLQDMRLWRQALRPPTFLDPRHYGPPDGIGARIAVVICHLGDIRRSGVLTVVAASDTRIELHGEFPPVDYQFTFDVQEEGPLTSTLTTRIVATPQALYPFRLLTKLKLRHLPESVDELFPALMVTLEAALMAMPEDPALHPRVTTDGFVEGPAATDIPEGKGIFVTLLDKPIALYKIEGRFFAIADYNDGKAPKRAKETPEGFILKDPRSGERFDLQSGLEVDGLGSIPTYPARIDGGKIYIRVQLI